MKEHSNAMTVMALRAAGAKIEEQAKSDVDGAWATLAAIRTVLPRRTETATHSDMVDAYFRLVWRVIKLRLDQRTTPGDIAAVIQDCLAVDADLAARAVPARSATARWAPRIALVVTLGILWGSAAALGVHRYLSNDDASGHQANAFPLTVFAMIGLVGLGATLAYEMLRPRDQWFQDTLAHKLSKELPEEESRYENTIIDLLMRAGRLKRGAAMALGGAVVAIILFTMFIYSTHWDDGTNPNVIVATRVGGGVLLMFIVGTLMAAHAFTLRLAAHYEAIGDLLRIGDIGGARKLLRKRVRFVMFWPPRLSQSAKATALDTIQTNIQDTFEAYFGRREDIVRARENAVPVRSTSRSAPVDSSGPPESASSAAPSNPVPGRPLRDSMSQGSDEGKLATTREALSEMRRTAVLDSAFEDLIAPEPAYVRRGARVLYYGVDPTESDDADFSMMELSREEQGVYLTRPRALVDEYKRKHAAVPRR